MADGSTRLPVVRSLPTRAESFLTDRPRPLAPKTLELYRNLLDRFILPTFGEVPIGSITTEAVRTWLSRVRNDSSELQSAKAYRLLPGDPERGRQ